jgi:hypothetical protein
LCCVVAGLVAIASMEALYVLTDLLCYTAGVCEVSLLPERLTYTFAISERLPVLGVVVVLPAVAIWRTWLATGSAMDARIAA